jgi:hypothetical protein
MTDLGSVSEVHQRLRYGQFKNRFIGLQAINQHFLETTPSRLYRKYGVSLIDLQSYSSLVTALTL